MNDVTSTGTKRMICLATYGSLKRGFWNYDRYCKGACSIEHVSIPGKLFALPSGIPVLQVPDECILAYGTHHPMADLDTQERYELDSYMQPDDATGLVHGELMKFDDPETRLPAIDRLEGFCPGGRGLYRRVLVYVYSGAEAIPAWCYVLGEHPIQSLSLTGKTSWP